MLAVAQDDHRFALQLMHDESPEGGAGPAAGPPGVPSRARRRPARQAARSGPARAAAIAGGRGRQGVTCEPPSRSAAGHAPAMRAPTMSFSSRAAC